MLRDALVLKLAAFDHGAQYAGRCAGWLARRLMQVLLFVGCLRVVCWGYNVGGCTRLVRYTSVLFVLFMVGFVTDLWQSTSCKIACLLLACSTPALCLHHSSHVACTRTTDNNSYGRATHGRATHVSHTQPINITIDPFPCVQRRHNHVAKQGGCYTVNKLLGALCANSTATPDTSSSPHQYIHPPCTSSTARTESHATTWSFSHPTMHPIMYSTFNMEAVAPTAM